MQDSDDSSVPLGEGQIRVSVRACGLNFADIFAAMGLYSATPKGTFTPGLEFSGVVSQVHPSVKAVRGSFQPKVCLLLPCFLGAFDRLETVTSAFSPEVHPGDNSTPLVVAPSAAADAPPPQVGDAVMGVTRFGGYTTVLNVGSAYVRPLPKGWSHTQGASFLCTTMTAWYGLVTLGTCARLLAVAPSLFLSLRETREN